jgi:Secretion system C-terminal sorting domain
MKHYNTPNLLGAVCGTAAWAQGSACLEQETGGKATLVSRERERQQSYPAITPITVAPNPVGSDQFTIQSQTAFQKIVVSDVMGKIHSTTAYAAAYKAVVRTNQLTSGTYFATVTMLDGTTQITKILVSH